jgi:hypothetical protein
VLNVKLLVGCILLHILNWLYRTISNPSANYLIKIVRSDENGLEVTVG